MKAFMDENFLLNNDCAVKLYHEYAKQMPIFDYHCHLIPKEIADNKREPSITSAWLYGDHYKWRQMRTNGYDETKGDDFQRFLNYADTVAHAIGNPLYHWSHLELQRFFDIHTPLSPKTAREIYDAANEKLKNDPSLDAYGIFKKFNVYAVGTTDDPIDSLEYHAAIKKAGKTATKVIPSFRPDKAMNIDAEGFNAYIDKLAAASGVKITSAADVMTALAKRLDWFVANGCVATDHAIIVPPYAPASDAKVNEVFLKARSGKAVTAEEAGMAAPEQLVYSLAGPQAQGRYGELVRRAEQMAREGRSDEEIRQETGAIKGFRGNWWALIDREGFSLKEDGIEDLRTMTPRQLFESGGANLARILDAPELFEAYPDLKTVGVQFEQMEPGEWGFTIQDGMSRGIYLNEALLDQSDWQEQITQVLLHETQHVIQGMEGRENGANPALWRDIQKAYAARARALAQRVQETISEHHLEGILEQVPLTEDFQPDTRQMSQAEIESFNETVDPVIWEMLRNDMQTLAKFQRIDPENHTAYDLYRQTVGEIEARAQEERGKWQQPDYRGAVALEDYFDVGRGQVRYSIQTLQDGTQYVEVDTDQDIFEGVPLEQYPSVIERYMTERYRGTVIGEGNQRAWVDRRATKEYARPERRGMDDDLYEAKARAGTELDNLMRAARFDRHVPYDPADTGHPENTGGWDWYYVYFAVPGSDVLYEGRINIEYVAKGKRFHDMTQIKETGIPRPGRNARQVEHDLSDRTIARNRVKANRQTGQKRKKDLKYIAAVNRGDMYTAQQMVEEAAEKAGYTMRVYHGTPTGGFTTFKGWSYFTENREYADRYQNASASSIRSRKETTNPMTYALLMNPGRVFDTRNPAIAEIYEQARMELGMGELDESGLPDWVEGRDLAEFIEENDLPYDTIILDEGADGGYGEDVVKRGFSYLTRSNQVKSAETVTRDDQGQVIPLSQRFNQEEPDIRFSISAPVERVRDLVAMHNVDQAGLDFALEMGGFASPSTAVVKSSQGHNMYGPISVVFRSGTIDPEASGANRLYGTDAWTPTKEAAWIETELKYEQMEAARDRGYTLLEGLDGHFRDELRRWYDQRINLDETTDTMDDWENNAWNNIGWLAAYRRSQGSDVAVQQREAARYYEDIGYHPDQSARYDAVLNALEARGQLDSFIRDMSGPIDTDGMVSKYGEALAEADQRFGTVVRLYTEKPGDLVNKKLQRIFQQLYRFQQDNRGRDYVPTQEADWDSTRNELQRTTDREGFRAWFRKQMEGVFGRRGIRNEADQFTPSGNRRTFRQLHNDVTLENIVKAMNRKDAKGGNAGSVSGVMATAAKEYRTLDEMRADEGRLQQMEAGAYEQLTNALQDRINSFISGVQQSDNDVYAVRDLVADAARAYAKAGKLNAIRTTFQRDGRTLTTEQVRELGEILRDAQEIPTGYFEAKPQRAVGFDEVAFVLLPEDMRDSDTARKLGERGVEVRYYDGDTYGEDGKRTQALNDALDEKGDVRFSLEGVDETDPAMDRLMAENQQFRDIIAQMTAELNRQEQRSTAQLTSKANMRRLARMLKTDWQVSLPISTMAENLGTIFEGLAKAQTPAEAQAAIRTLGDFCRDAIMNASATDRTAYDEFSEARALIHRNLRADRKTILDVFGDMSSYRRNGFGRA